jgi:hypothetical protein
MAQNDKIEITHLVPEEVIEKKILLIRKKR